MPQDAAVAAFPAVERRFEPRFSFDADVEIEWGSSTLKGRAMNISHKGMFLLPAEPLWLGARFVAKLLTDPPIQIECTINRVEPGRGVAVKIAVPDPEEHAHFMELLSTLDSPQ